MDRSNLRWLSRIIGDDPKKKVHLMMSYTGNGRDVADPWHSGDFEHASDPKELFENGHRVKYYLDRDLLDTEKVSFHPCENTASVVISKEGLLKFLAIWGGEGHYQAYS